MRIKTVKPLKKPIACRFSPAENTAFIGESTRPEYDEYKRHRDPVVRVSLHPILDDTLESEGGPFERAVAWDYAPGLEDDHGQYGFFSASCRMQHGMSVLRDTLFAMAEEFPEEASFGEPELGIAIMGLDRFENPEAES